MQLLSLLFKESYKHYTSQQKIQYIATFFYLLLSLSWFFGSGLLQKVRISDA